MELDPQDQDIVKLLTKLKEKGGNYPEHLFAARRQNYLTRIGELEAGLGTGKGNANAVKHGGTSTPAPVASTVLETALVITMIAEASAVAYFYRDQFANLFQSTTTGPKVQEVSSPPAPAVTAALAIQGVSPSPAITVTLPSVTISASPITTAVTVSSTPIPGVVDNNNVNSAGANQTHSTPVLNGPNGNEGNHYGQTPKPERTKAPGSNQGTSNNPSPRDQSRPTQTR